MSGTHFDPLLALRPTRLAKLTPLRQEGSLSPSLPIEYVSSDSDVGMPCGNLAASEGYSRTKEGLPCDSQRASGATCLAPILFCAISGWAQLSNASSNSNLLQAYGGTAPLGHSKQTVRKPALAKIRPASRSAR
jgi:hypothetical protein